MSSKDKRVTIWRIKDGSLFGSISHKGAINCVDVNCIIISIHLKLTHQGFF